MAPKHKLMEKLKKAILILKINKLIRTIKKMKKAKCNNYKKKRNKKE